VADDKGPIERAADLFVYAPIGFAVLARDLGAAALADMAKRGRSEIDQAQKRVGNQITQYRFVGQYAVDQELTPRVKPVVDELKRAFDRLTGGFGSSSPTAPARPAHSPATAPAPAPVAPQPVASNGAAADVRAQQEADRAAAAALPIPDYDELSASHVVERLAGLTPSELQAVAAYENSRRRRKTILSRIEQLTRQ